MGFVDRGGSRESKGNSLRRSKKNPGAAAARAAGAKQAIKPPAQPEVAPALAKANKRNDFFDTSAALLSRQFDADIEDVLDRAEQNCAAVVVWSADIDKQQQVVVMSQENSGLIYAAVGLHPDNVRGTHQREFDKWFQQVEDVSKMRGCVAILSGLNLSRETATHFPQETVLKTMMATAKKNGRPLILHCAHKHHETAERLLVLLEEYHSENSNAFPTPVVLHTFLTATNFNVPLVKKFAALGCFFTVSAAELHSLAGGDVAAAQPATAAGAAASAASSTTTARTAKQCEEDLSAFVECFFTAVAPSCILLASDSPWHTPQTIEDDYIRTQKNEPSNFPHVIEAMELAVKAFAKQQQKQQKDEKVDENEEKALLAKLKNIVSIHKDTSLKVFGIPEKDVEVVTSPNVTSPAEGKDKKGNKNKNGGDNGEEEDDDNSNSKKKGGANKKGGKGGKNDDIEDEDAAGNKKGGNSKKGKKKGVRFDDSDSEGAAEEDNSSKKKENAKKPAKKGGKKNRHDDSESDEESNSKATSAPPASSLKKGGKSKKRDDSDEEEDTEAADNTKASSKAPLRSQKRGGGGGAANTHYACLKCRTMLFNPSDLIVPDDASLSANSFFVKVSTSGDNNNNAANNNDDNEEDGEEDENNRYLPATLRITPHTNGEIECRKCGAGKLGRAGFKLGVPGFGIKITPSKVEVVDTEVSLEELQQRAIAEAEKYQAEAEAAENASSDDDDRKGKRTQKKNVKQNNRSNFTCFRNKNFAPKVAKGVDDAEVFNAHESDSDEDSSEERQQKGKRRK